MKKQIFIFVILVSLILAFDFINQQKITKRNILGTQTQQTPTPTPSCDQSLWQHVYNPQRLQVIDPCKTVTGHIEEIRTEEDGDYHIKFRLDPQYGNLVNEMNVQKQDGDLIVEPICQLPVYQEDAQASCQNFQQKINFPKGLEHLSIMGRYVLDTQHGWMEIHPLTSINIIP